jgi:hypothetical protein
VAISAALRGAGGYGKTTLARALIHDVRVRGAFDDGILWITLGEKPSGNPLFIQIALARYAKNGRNMRRVVDQMQQGSSFFSTFQNLFSSLYQALSPAAKQVALDAAQYTEEITRDDLEADAAHHLADAEQFEQALTELVDQHVLKPSDIPGYYTIHPLVRAYLVRILERNDSY